MSRASTSTALSDNFNDDLFEHTTMSFGEHIEELRSSLWKALLSLAVGFLFGLCIGKPVVAMITLPLENALHQYYAEESTNRTRSYLERLADEGDPLAKELLANESFKELIEKDGMLVDEVYLMPDAVLAELAKQDPQRLRGITIPERSAKKPIRKSEMARLLLWHSNTDDERVKARSFSAQEPFMIWMKAALLVGALVSSPFAFYFLWSFIAAGLYPHEKRYVNVFLPFSVGLFLLGAAVAFLFVFPPVLGFFFSFNRWLGIDPDPRISEWLSFVLLLPLAFGVSFQLPLVMLFLERIGVFTVSSYLSKWRISVLVIAVASMVLSPGGDPYSMMLMFIPLVGLYFAGIGLCKWLPAQRNPYATD